MAFGISWQTLPQKATGTTATVVYVLIPVKDVGEILKFLPGVLSVQFPSFRRYNAHQTGESEASDAVMESQ